MPNDKKGTQEFAPSEDQILKELKQREQRKAYMNTPKALTNRKAYQERKKEQAKLMREYLKANPEVEARMREEHPEIFGGK